MRYIILCNILYKTNIFAIAKTEAILCLVEPICKKENLYINAFNRKDLVFNKRDSANIDETAKIFGKNKDIKMPNIRHILPKSKHIISS